MSKERRYQDHEIRQILDLAIGEEDGPAQSPSAADGLTLLDLQEVGREVGVPPERMTQAVAVFERHGEAVPRGTTIGLPTSVERIVPLPRNLSDHEWELLIAELRTTFGGSGVATSQGGLREWRHGRLQAFIEPTATGHRLRMTDVNAAIGGIVLGGFVLAFALLIQLVLINNPTAGLRFAAPAFFALFGGGLALGSAISLPRWARKQEKRMEHISTQAVSLVALPGARDN
ncbi:MAG: hypothetical protein IPP90_21975 [Gemmatimonadaceae bacterium]|nr:hypothetical protein [Gemmatimonadaceae bacterium]